MRRLALILTAGLLMAAAPLPPTAAPDRQLDDPALETRAQAIDRSLRCVVCQNESIAESDAVLAADLRAIVRERVAAGDSDDEVRSYLVARYGEFVLMKPPMGPETWLLWFGPLLVLLVGGGAVAAYLLRRRGQPEVAPLSEAERRRLDGLLDEEDA